MTEKTCANTAGQAEPASRAYRAFFFDLDGTLLPLDLDAFLGSYFKLIVEYGVKCGYDAESFKPAFEAGIKNMLVHEGQQNASLFWDAFHQITGRDVEEAQRVFMTFYKEVFPQIGELVTPNPATARALNTLAEKGYPLVLATMPLFPRLAVEERLRWAGVDASLFARITTYENSTAGKPSSAYYRENLQAANTQGADLIMVGNNTVEDILPATELGLDTYLVTDYLIDPANFDLSQVKHGSMEDFAAWVDTLPLCANPLTNISDALIG